MDPFLARPGVKLELSRACIHRDFRKGVVMNLLWRGLVQYIQQVEAAYLFGCASVKTMDPGVVTQLSEYLEGRGFVDHLLDVKPLKAYEFPPLEGVPAPVNSESLIPPLLGSYLKAGAKVAPLPALDREFKCTDFLTVLRMEDLTRLYERKYTQ